MARPPAQTSATVGVVHLLPDIRDPASPPDVMWFAPRLGVTGRVVMALVLTAITAVCAVALVALWTTETPGWWFTAIFTVMTGGIPVAGWVIYAGSIGEAERERRQQARWAGTRGAAQAVRGTVLERAVATTEDGTVSEFDLTVSVPGASPLQATWHRSAQSPKYLLQTQVPGVGAEVRVWTMDDGRTGAPIVVEVADPSVVG